MLEDIAENVIYSLCSCYKCNRWGILKIRDGYLDIVVAGGSEASITPLAVAGFASMRALSESTDKIELVFLLTKKEMGL